MRKLIYLCIVTCIVIMPMSCKDDNDVIPAAPKLLLTKIERNGVTKLELTYDTEKKLIRVDYYGQATLSSYTLYEYNDQGVKEARRYDGDDHELNYKTVFTLDNFGRVIKGENYSSPEFEEVASTSTYSYAPSGKLISKQFIAEPGDLAYYLHEYTYSATGHQTSIKSTLYPKQPGERVNYQTDYTPSDKSVPNHWNDYIFLLVSPGLDGLILEMFNVSTYHQSWNTDGEHITETRTDATEQEYDSDGYLTRQVLTRVNLLNPAADNVTEMTYEYTQ